MNRIRDAIVVGARVAGASTAMLLARRGYDVLLVDRDPLPSEKAQSTHLIHPPGVRYLRDWGVLDALLASNCPPIYEYGLSVGSIDLMAELSKEEDLRSAIAPRRRILDGVLLSAAIRACVEVRDRTQVTGLVEEGSRVVGVTLRSGSVQVVERARIVIGADGVNSRFATWTGSRKYLERPRRLTSIWNYWPDMGIEQVPTWRDENNYAFAWPTNDGCVIAGVAWRSEDFKRLDLRDKSKLYLDAIARVAPALRERMSESAPAEEWRTASVPNYFRESWGPGWALVGDAGYCRDPATASGITDALRGADHLSTALHKIWSSGQDEARTLRAYEHRRNGIQRPYFEYTTDFAKLVPYTPDVERVITLASEDPEHAIALTGLFAQTADPREVFSPVAMGRILRSGGRVPGFRLKMLRAATSPAVTRIPRASGIATRMLASQLGEFGDYLRTAGSEDGPVDSGSTRVRRGK